MIFEEEFLEKLTAFAVANPELALSFLEKTRHVLESTAPNGREVKMKIGDVVRLKAGGPWMTVEFTDKDAGRDSVGCVYFDSEGNRQRDKFYVDTLKIRELGDLGHKIQR